MAIVFFTSNAILMFFEHMNFWKRLNNILAEFPVVSFFVGNGVNSIFLWQGLP